MTKPLVVFGDATAAAIKALREALADRGEPYARDVTVSARIPRDRSTEHPKTPYVLVRIDATQRITYPVHLRCVIAVTVWHDSAEAAHDLAGLCVGLLAQHSGPVLRAVRPLDGPIPVVDSESGQRMSLARLTADLRPQSID